MKPDHNLNLDRPRPLWSWIVATVVAVPVLYPLLWGPALWLQFSGFWPISMIWADHVYDPLRWIIAVAPNSVEETFTMYLLWWASHANMPEP